MQNNGGKKLTRGTSTKEVEVLMSKNSSLGYNKWGANGNTTIDNTEKQAGTEHETNGRIGWINKGTNQQYITEEGARGVYALLIHKKACPLRSTIQFN